jgi:hypothetical protein
VDERRVITAREAQQCLGIPASTIRSWVRRGKLYACSIGPRREHWFRLVDMLTLWMGWTARTAS